MVDFARPRFPLGQIVATPGALTELAEAGQSSHDFLARHQSGDWGETDTHDSQANEDALQDGARVFSVYRTARGVKIWIITEADRASTCILLPEEY
jgi:hypothetical protein